MIRQLWHPGPPETVFNGMAQGSAQLDTIDTMGMWSSMAVANTAYYVPITIQYPVVLTKFYWYQAKSFSIAGNFDVGLYDFAGNKLTSTGSQSGSPFGMHVVDVTDYEIPRGRYWIGQAVDNVNSWCIAFNSGIAEADAFGVKEQASAWSSGLPTTATFSAPTTTQAFHLAGFITESTL